MITESRYLTFTDGTAESRIDVSIHAHDQVAPDVTLGIKAAFGRVNVGVHFGGTAHARAFAAAVIEMADAADKAAAELRAAADLEAS